MMTETDHIKVVVRLKRRPDGGLRAWSDQVPELVLSHPDPDQVQADIAPALAAILEAKMGYAFEVAQVTPLPTARTRVAAYVLARGEVIQSRLAEFFGRRQVELVAQPAC